MPESEETGTVKIQILPFGSLQLASELVSEPEEAAEEEPQEETMELLEESTAYTRIVSLPSPALRSGPPLF